MSNAASGNGKEHGAGKPIAIYYEQQHWFRPLFEQLDASVRTGSGWMRGIINTMWRPRSASIRCSSIA